MQSELAVAIAKDILDRLDQLHFRQRMYIFTPSVDFGEDTDLTKEAMFYQLEESCQVCALGACVLSLFRLKGQIGNLNYIRGEAGYHYLMAYSDQINDTLNTVFTANELQLIEIAFEGRTTGSALFLNSTYPSREEIFQAVHFCGESDTLPNRIRAIMQNIITNDGHFIPGEKT